MDIGWDNMVKRKNKTDNPTKKDLETLQELEAEIREAEENLKRLKQKRFEKRQQEGIIVFDNERFQEILEKSVKVEMEFERQKQTRGLRGRFLPKPRLETRVRSAFIFIRGNRTPGTGNSFIKRTGTSPIDEAIIATSLAYQHAVKTGIQGLPPKPWIGTANITGEGGQDIVSMLQLLATDPRPGVVRQVIRQISNDLGITLHAEITISWRKVETVINARGRMVEKHQIIPGLPNKEIIIAEEVINISQSE